MRTGKVGKLREDIAEQHIKVKKAKWTSDTG